MDSVSGAICAMRMEAFSSKHGGGTPNPISTTARIRGANETRNRFPACVVPWCNSDQPGSCKPHERLVSVCQSAIGICASLRLGAAHSPCGHRGCCGSRGDVLGGGTV